MIKFSKHFLIVIIIIITYYYYYCKALSMMAFGAAHNPFNVWETRA